MAAAAALTSPDWEAVSTVVVLLVSGLCVGGEGEEYDACGVEVHVGGVVDEGPDVGDKELLRRILFHILEL